MGQLALGAVGAVVGGVLSGGNPLAIQAGFALGSIAGAFIFPSGQDQRYEGPRLGDLTVTSSTYGAPIVEGIGTARINGNIIWTSGIREVKTEESHDVGKGGGPTVTNVTYSYYASFALGLCRGVKKQVLRMWADGILIYDVTGASNSDVQAIDGLNFRFYPGNKTQLPDSIIEAAEGAGNVPAFRNLCYIVFDNLPLAKFGNRLPNITVEITEDATPHKNYNMGDKPVGHVSSSIVYDKSLNQIIVYGNDAIHFYDANTAAYVKTVSIESMLVFDKDMIPGPDLFPPFSVGAISVASDQFMAFSPETQEIAVNRGRVSFIDKYTLKEIRHTKWDGPSFDQFAPGAKGNFTLTDSEIPAMVTTRRDIFFALNHFDGQNFTCYNATTGHTIQLDLDPYLDGGPYWSILGYGSMQAAVGPVTTEQAQIIIIGLTSWEFGDGGTPYCELIRLKIYNGIIFLSEPPIDVPNPDVIFVEGNIKIYGDDLGGTADQQVKLRSLIYDPTDDTLLMFGAVGSGVGSFNFIAKLDYHSQSILWINNTTVSTLPTGTNGSANTRAYNGSFAWADGNYAFLLNTKTGEVTSQQWNLSPDDISFGGGSLFVGEKGSVYSFGEKLVQEGLGFTGAPKLFRIRLNTFTADVQNLAPYVQAIMERAGLESSEIDVSALNADTIWGYYWSNPAPARDILAPLATKYLFDQVESDATIKTIKRGGTPLLTISENELGIVDSDTNDVLQSTTTQEVELPAKVTVQYADRERDYQSNAQTVKRPSNPVATMLSDNQVTLQSPIAQTATEAKRTSEVLLYSAWQERTGYQLAPSNRYMYLDPTDVVTIELDDLQVDIRIAKQFIGADFSLQWEGVGTDGASYTSTTTGDGGQIPINTLPTIVPSKLFVLDLPMLKDTEAQTNDKTYDYIAIVSQERTGFRGAFGYTSTDGGDTYEQVYQTGNAAAWGSLQTQLPDENIYSVDYSYSVIIVTRSGSDQIQSCTYEELLNGANALAVQASNGEWEIIQFLTATPSVDTNSYELTGILRGVRGTDWLVGMHNAGDTFIMLSSSVTGKLSFPIAEVDDSRLWKAVSYGQIIDSVEGEPFTTRGNEWRPWMPAEWQASISTGGIDISWERRTRYNGGLTDGTGTVPLNEGAEAYEVEIYDAPGTTLKRTLSGISSPSVTYLAADIATDFGSTPTTLTLKIFQISSIAEIDRGFSRLQTIDVE